MTVIFMPTIRRVEPVEINAGAWYLRAPRDDDLIDDRPALADLGETDPDYVTHAVRALESRHRLHVGGLRTDDR